MSRKSALVLLLVIVLVSLQYSRFQQNRVEASDGYPVHNVNSGLNYTTIQEAISANETLEGNVIRVDAGIYNESVLIFKSISLEGEGGDTTIINGYGKLWVFSINANNVTLSGFTVEEGGRNLNIASNGGILIESNSCSVHDNTIKYSDNYGYGIRVPFSGEGFFTGNLIENNTIINCYTGIWLTGENCILRNNTAGNCTFGAYVQGSNNILRENNFADNRFDFGATNMQDIDETNLVSGKPIIYWIDQHDRVTSVNAGYVSLLNCVNITIAGIIAGRVTEGISLINTTNSRALLLPCYSSVARTKVLASAASSHEVHESKNLPPRNTSERTVRTQKK
jgi:parallel beta-helix repeat protein